MISHPWRQGLHLEPPQGWLNDPNGLAYFQHRYHVFFQFCPQSAGGVGAKCWGHYESPDLVHWTYTGAPLQPGGLYDLGDAYSGSAVAQGDTLWLYYTGNYKAPGPHDYIHTGRHHNTIRVAFDGRQCQGRKQLLLSNLDYPRHCTLHVRDPKVWQEGRMWWMVLGARDQADRGEVLLYRSPDGEKWSLERELKILLLPKNKNPMFTNVVIIIPTIPKIFKRTIKTIGSPQFCLCIYRRKTFQFIVLQKHGPIQNIETHQIFDIFCF